MACVYQKPPLRASYTDYPHRRRHQRLTSEHCDFDTGMNACSPGTVASTL